RAVWWRAQRRPSPQSRRSRSSRLRSRHRQRAMCGFAAWFDPAGRPCDRGWLEEAAGLLAHRGPDAAGFHLEPGLGLAFRRLSIVDVAHGAQPLANEDGRVWIAYTGQLYNHGERRREL